MLKKHRHKLFLKTKDKTSKFREYCSSHRHCSPISSFSYQPLCLNWHIFPRVLGPIFPMDSKSGNSWTVTPFASLR